MLSDPSQIPSTQLRQLLRTGQNDAARALCREWASHPVVGQHYRFMLRRLGEVHGASVEPPSHEYPRAYAGAQSVTLAEAIRVGLAAQPYTLAASPLPAEAEWAAARDRLIASSPFKAEIYRPTAKVALRDQVLGIERVVQLTNPANIEVSRQRFEHLRQLIRSRGTRRLFVVGNGPSLKQMDLSLLRDEITIGFNGIFLHPTFTPTIYVVEDHLVAEDRAREIMAYRCPVKLFPSYLGYCIEPQDNTIFLNHRPRISFPVDTDFSDDAGLITYTGGTVTYTGLQIAASLGVEQVILIGVDASYKVRDVERSDTYGTGVLTSKSDDANHFDPRYFGAGYRWHDPNVHTMLQAYRKARDHGRQRGVAFINATVGGQLEVFPRRDFHSFFPRESVYPRLAVLDFTSLQRLCATGRIKRNLLRGWGPEALLNVISDQTATIQALQTMRNDQYARDLDKTSILPALRSLIEFDPELLYLRPTADRPLLTVLQTVAGFLLERPWVTHYMDDWLARLESTSPGPLANSQREVMSYLFGQGARTLAICDKMRSMLQHRHGIAPERLAVVHNCITLGQILPRHRRAGGSRVLRYFGGMEADMSLATLLACSRQIEEAAGRDESGWRFEIYTAPHGLQRQGHLFSAFRHTRVLPQLEDDAAYFEALAGSDANLVCYNFDEPSVRYVRYSLANKLPDLLSVEAPFVAIGHPDIGTMGLLADEQYPLLGLSHDFDLSGLLAMVAQPDAQSAQALDASRSRLRTRFADSEQRIQFQSLLRVAAASRQDAAAPPLPALRDLVEHAGKHWPTPVRDEARLLLGLTRLPIATTRAWLQRVRSHGLAWSVRDELKALVAEVGSVDALARASAEVQARCVAMLVCGLAAERFEPINLHTRAWLLSLGREA
jgi:hypothetical protein